VVGRLLISIVAAAVAGCATHYSWRAAVPLSSFVSESCLAESLEFESDVFDVVTTGAAQFAFRLSLPDVKRADSPSFSVHARLRDGQASLVLSTTYPEGLFDPSSGPQRLRARALVIHIAEVCTGQRPTLGEPHACGAGEEHDLCVPGSL
jgi:hypothetical protein